MSPNSQKDVYSVDEFKALQSKSCAKTVKKRKASAQDSTPDLFCAFVSQETGHKTVKEHAFHPERNWRFDYAIPSIRFAIEVEGGVFKKRKYINKKGEEITTIGGRHNTAEGFINDIEKYNAAAIMGWCVYRCLPSQLNTMETIKSIKAYETRKSILYQE